MAQLKYLAKGLITWIPGVRSRFFNPSEDLPASGAYSYGVWLKHLTLLSNYGMNSVPRTVLELGPGASVGTGVAALLSGAEHYIGVDAIAHARHEANIRVAQDVIARFQERAPRPSAGWPPFDQYLDARLFPGNVLTEERLGETLAPARVARIIDAVARAGSDSQTMIDYHTWDDPDPVAAGHVDMIFSHVVLNHVQDLDMIYGHCARWLKPGGWMSHQVDFTSLETAEQWNGHLAFGERAWKVMSGRRAYHVNRERLSTHLRLLSENGFKAVTALRGIAKGGITRAEMAPRWRDMSDEDFETRTGFLIAQRQPSLH